MMDNEDESMLSMRRDNEALVDENLALRNQLKLFQENCSLRAATVFASLIAWLDSDKTRITQTEGVVRKLEEALKTLSPENTVDNIAHHLPGFNISSSVPPCPKPSPLYATQNPRKTTSQNTSLWTPNSEPQKVPSLQEAYDTWASYRNKKKPASKTASGEVQNKSASRRVSTEAQRKQGGVTRATSNVSKGPTQSVRQQGWSGKAVSEEEKGEQRESENVTPDGGKNQSPWKDSRSYQVEIKRAVRTQPSPAFSDVFESESLCETSSSDTDDDAAPREWSTHGHIWQRNQAYQSPNTARDRPILPTDAPPTPSLPPEHVQTPNPELLQWKDVLNPYTEPFPDQKQMLTQEWDDTFSPAKNPQPQIQLTPPQKGAQAPFREDRLEKQREADRQNLTANHMPAERRQVPIKEQSPTINYLPPKEVLTPPIQRKDPRSPTKNYVQTQDVMATQPGIDRQSPTKNYNPTHDSSTQSQNLKNQGRIYAQAQQGQVNEDVGSWGVENGQLPSDLQESLQVPGYRVQDRPTQDNSLTVPNQGRFREETKMESFNKSSPRKFTVDRKGTRSYPASPVPGRTADPNYSYNTYTTVDESHQGTGTGRIGAGVLARSEGQEEGEETRQKEKGEDYGQKRQIHGQEERQMRQDKVQEEVGEEEEMSIGFNHVGHPVATSTPHATDNKEKRQGTGIPPINYNTDYSSTFNTSYWGQRRAEESRHANMQLDAILHFLNNAKPNKRLIGEVAYQLDRRILSYVFNINQADHPYRRRFYGYTLQNIHEMIQRESLDRNTGRFDPATVDKLTYRLQYVLQSLAPLGYDMKRHALYSADLVNRYGLLPIPPNQGIADLFSLANKKVVSEYLKNITPRQEVKDVMILFDCLALMAEDEAKPLFSW